MDVSSVREQISLGELVLKSGDTSVSNYFLDVFSKDVPLPYACCIGCEQIISCPAQSALVPFLEHAQKCPPCAPLVKALFPTVPVKELIKKSPQIVSTTNGHTLEEADNNDTFCKNINTTECVIDGSENSMFYARQLGINNIHDANMYKKLILERYAQMCCEDGSRLNLVNSGSFRALLQLCLDIGTNCGRVNLDNLLQSSSKEFNGFAAAFAGTSEDQWTSVDPSLVRLVYKRATVGPCWKVDCDGLAIFEVDRNKNFHRCKKCHSKRVAKDDGSNSLNVQIKVLKETPKKLKIQQKARKSTRTIDLNPGLPVLDTPMEIECIPPITPHLESTCLKPCLAVHDPPKVADGFDLKPNLEESSPQSWEGEQKVIPEPESLPVQISSPVQSPPTTSAFSYADTSDSLDESGLLKRVRPCNDCGHGVRLVSRGRNVPKRWRCMNRFCRKGYTVPPEEVEQQVASALIIEKDFQPPENVQFSAPTRKSIGPLSKKTKRKGSAISPKCSASLMNTDASVGMASSDTMDLTPVVSMTPTDTDTPVLAGALLVTRGAEGAESILTDSPSHPHKKKRGRPPLDAAYEEKTLFNKMFGHLQQFDAHLGQIDQSPSSNEDTSPQPQAGICTIKLPPEDEQGRRACEFCLSGNVRLLAQGYKNGRRVKKWRCNKHDCRKTYGQCIYDEETIDDNKLNQATATASVTVDSINDITSWFSDVKRE